ncbi:MAG: regulator SirB [SAR86 cluster bacterium]|uniref:Regulator SirB n=1 Tax=SAR86 cluster bacterium TaxID=2030880 RepID=A0A2A5CBC6_9GAMM|nr:MAG: regulator SirB [SAR86 cluster bacterium]
MYLTFKTLHMTFALLSFTGFLFRSYLMFIDSKWLNHKAVLLIPHLVDGMFLACGFWMAFMVNFGLFNQPWLSMKVLLLMFYLFFVGLTLGRGRTKSIRVVSFFCGVFTFIYIVGIAINKTAYSWFVLL